MIDRYRDRLNLVLVSNADGRHNPAAARNRGVDHARGEFILFCDADDVVDDGWAEAMQDAFLEHDFVCARWGYRRLNDSAAIAAYGGNHEGLFYWTSEPSIDGTEQLRLRPCRSGELVSSASGGACTSPSAASTSSSSGAAKTRTTAGGSSGTRARVCSCSRRRDPLPVPHQPLEHVQTGANGGASRVSLWMRWREQLPVPQRRWSAGFWAWARVFAQLRHVRDRGTFGRWIRMVGDLAGHAEASARYGVVLLCSDPGLVRRPRRLPRVSASIAAR